MRRKKVNAFNMTMRDMFKMNTIKNRRSSIYNKKETLSMKENLNNILLRRRSSVYIEPDVLKISDESKEGKKILIDVCKKNLASAGFKISENLENGLMNASLEEIVNISKQLSSFVSTRLGADVEYHPMYHGFPASVLERSDVQLYIDAFVYALSGFTILPYDPENLVRSKEIEEAADYLSQKYGWMKHMIENTADPEKLDDPVIIDAANKKDIHDIAKNLMSSQVAFSQEDKADLLVMMQNLDGFETAIPEKIPNKENLVFLASKYEDAESMKGKNPFISKLETPVDLMRYIVTVSGGDPTMKNIVPIKNFSRSNAREIALSFIKMKNVERDVYSRRELFKRISERCHFRTILKGMPENKRMQKLLDNVYQKTGERSFTSGRDHLLTNENDFQKLVEHYKKNPGQMGKDLRMLAGLAEKLPNKENNIRILAENLKENAWKMSTMNLLKVNAFLKRTSEELPFRVFSPNKGMSNLYAVENTERPLTKETVEKLSETITDVLKERYKEKRPLGKVYIDKSLQGIKVPVQQRLASEKSAGLSYGSRFDLKKDTNILRTYIWWTNNEKYPENPVDIDLSARIYNKDLNTMVDISYYDLKNSFGVHSGDLRDGGNPNGKGAAEFIDIDLNKLKECNGAYVMFSARIYYGESFSETPCKFGWMQSEKTPEKLFDISKAERAIDITSNTERDNVMLLDVEKMRMIWMDRAVIDKDMKGLIRENNNISHAIPDSVEAYRALHNTVPGLYDLIEIHAAARGDEIVDDPKKADTIFTLNKVDPKNYPDAKEFICAFDADVILGDLVPDTLNEKDKEYFEKEKESDELLIDNSNEEIEID